jgi:hypothetical protein
MLYFASRLLHPSLAAGYLFASISRPARSPRKASGGSSLMTPRARRAIFSLDSSFSASAPWSAPAAGQSRRSVGSGRVAVPRQSQGLHQRLRAGRAELRRADQRRQGGHGHLRRRHPRHAARTLDPHSSFHDPKDYAKMRKISAAATTASAWSFSSSRTRFTSVTPYEDTPSFRAGIHPGRHHRFGRRQIHGRHDLRAGRQDAQGT